ncbi:MAG: tRNA (adenosine(37)-N6)-dimethylallyltransferase MiaA [Odoribacteraceae bacterium]|nr:tRNA (adenosine(37)-N6)-dimethylallyltransferase MiaA [Odoribacteraceae bacterium]
MEKETYQGITILGATATGKTALAVAVARAARGEIISADSRQVYRGMDIGTGKDMSEYARGGPPVPVHLVDVVEAGQRYNVYDYQRDFRRAWDDCLKRGVAPVICGGSGLYLAAILQGYRLTDVPRNPALRESLSEKSLEELARLLATYRPLHNKTDADTVERATRGIEIADYYRSHPPTPDDFRGVNTLVVGVVVERERRRERITARLRARLDEGLIEEVQGLMERGVSAEDLIYYGLEYRCVALHLTGKLSREEMLDQLNSSIHRFAKRQMTWFRKMEREGCKIHWIDGEWETEAKVEQVMKWFNE